MAWRRKRGQSLPKANITQFHNAYMHQTASVSELSDFENDIDLYFIPSVKQCLCLVSIDVYIYIDIGQFFRERSHFDNDYISVFQIPWISLK